MSHLQKKKDWLVVPLGTTLLFIVDVPQIARVWVALLALAISGFNSDLSVLLTCFFCVALLVEIDGSSCLPYSASTSFRFIRINRIHWRQVVKFLAEMKENSHNVIDVNVVSSFKRTSNIISLPTWLCFWWLILVKCYFHFSLFNIHLNIHLPIFNVLNSHKHWRKVQLKILEV